MNNFNIAIACFLIFFTGACQSKSPSSEAKTLHESTTKNYIHDFPAVFPNGDINVVIEIPAGSVEKWEVDKTNGQLNHQHVNGQPRIIKYLPYPGNYGMIPNTLLSKRKGGDGDPLDVIVLGPAIKRGEVIKCKLIGVLQLLDGGEKDDKLIAVQKGHELYKVNSIKELNEQFNGVLEIIELWFLNYKGEGVMTSKGIGDVSIAKTILDAAIKEYELKNLN